MKIFYLSTIALALINTSLASITMHESFHRYDALGTVIENQALNGSSPAINSEGTYWRADPLWKTRTVPNGLVLPDQGETTHII